MIEPPTHAVLGNDDILTQRYTGKAPAFCPLDSPYLACMQDTCLKRILDDEDFMWAGGQPAQDAQGMIWRASRAAGNDHRASGPARVDGAKGKIEVGGILMRVIPFDFKRARIRHHRVTARLAHGIRIPAK